MDVPQKQVNPLVALVHMFVALVKIGAKESFRAVWMAGWEGRSLAGEAHGGHVWVAVNGSPATITIETCEDPGDWTTAIGGMGPSGWALCGWGLGHAGRPWKGCRQAQEASWRKCQCRGWSSARAQAPVWTCVLWPPGPGPLAALCSCLW